MTKILEMTSEPGMRVYPFIGQDDEPGLNGYLSVFDSDPIIGVNLSVNQLTPAETRQLIDALWTALFRVGQNHPTLDTAVQDGEA